MDAKELGQRIRAAREAQGMSQDELAELISRDQRSVSEYESGKRRIFANDLPTIAQALHVPLMYFFQNVLSPDDLDMATIELLHQLDIDTRREFIAVLGSLIPLLRR